MLFISFFFPASVRRRRFGGHPRNGYNIPLFPQKRKRFQNFFQLFLRSQVIVMQSVTGDGEKILRNLKKSLRTTKKRDPGLGFCTLSGRWVFTQKKTACGFRTCQVFFSVKLFYLFFSRGFFCQSGRFICMAAFRRVGSPWVGFYIPVKFFFSGGFLPRRYIFLSAVLGARVISGMPG